MKNHSCIFPVLLMLCALISNKAAAQFEVRGQTGISEERTYFAYNFTASARYFVHERVAVGIDASLHHPMGWVERERKEFAEGAINTFMYSASSEYYINKNKLQGYVGLSVNYDPQHRDFVNEDGQVIDNWNIWVNPRIGLRYAFNDRWGAFAEYGYRKFIYSRGGAPMFDDRIWDFGFGCSYRF